MFSLFNPLDFNDPVGYFIPIFILLILMELYLFKQKKIVNYEKKDTIASLSLGFGSVFINLITVPVYVGIYFWLYNHRIFDNLGPSSSNPFTDWNWHKNHWYIWVILFFADDFTFYWHHRISHEVRVFWAAHINHHDSQIYNLGTALRQSWTELFYKFILWFWMPILGFHPIMILTMMHLSLIYQFWVHTELVNKLGFMEKIFSTPSAHRVHHSSDIAYLDKNYGGTLIIWDRIFGTYKAETFRPKYGITTNINTFNPFSITAHEWKNIWRDIKSTDSFKDKIKYLFLAPGWSHNGKDQRAKTLQKEL